MIIDIVYGFLGAGKTTFLKYLLENPPEGEKLAVLVNEFGDVGLDGAILGGGDPARPDIVEMPSGCICCTIATDFRRQIMDLHERFAPDRLLIEPTGVATISQITGILDRQDMSALHTRVGLILILDASEFLSFVKSHRFFMENQIRAAATVLLNKIDLVGPNMPDLLAASVREINPDAAVHPVEFARLDPEVLGRILDAPPPRSQEGSVDEAEHDHGLAAQYQTVGRRYPRDIFDEARLRDFFEGLLGGTLGTVVRAKGIFRTETDWVRIEISGGRIHAEKSPAVPESIVSIIGQFLNAPEMDRRIAACRKP